MPEQFTDTLSDTLGLGLAIGDAYKAPPSFPTFKGYLAFATNSTSVHQITNLTLTTTNTTAVGGSIAAGDTLVLITGFNVWNTGLPIALGLGSTAAATASFTIQSWASSDFEGGVIVMGVPLASVPSSIYVGPNITGTISPIAGGTNLVYESMVGYILVFGGTVALSGTPTNLTAQNGNLPPSQSITASTAGQMAFVVGGGGLRASLSASGTMGTSTLNRWFDSSTLFSTLSATFAPTPTTLSVSYSTATLGTTQQASGSTSFVLTGTGSGVSYDLYDQTADQITTTDTSGYNTRPAGLATDTVTLGETTGQTMRLAVLLADAIVGSEATGTGSQLIVTTADGLSMGEAAAVADRVRLTATDTLTLARSLALASRYVAVAVDGVTLTERIRTAVSALATDATAFSEDTLFKLGGLIMREQMRVADQPIPNTIMRMLTSELLRVSDRLRAGLPVTALDQVSVSYALQVFRGIAIAERLGLADSLLARARTGLTLSDQVNFYDSLRRFFAADAADQMTVTEALASLRRAVSVATDAVTLGDVSSPKMLLRVTSRDQLSLTDAQALRMIFKPDLLDGLEIAGAYVAPDGNLTTWAVNTRTGATTEYTGYNFNSFTRMGLRYLGANATGLYELDGDDDAGTDIIAAMKGGFLQFNGSRFAGMKAVYLGIRGEGEFFLKLEAGTGETYTYKVIAETMETSKVWIGKGLRHRYISYELISTGQDFDLESIEFVPMLAQRRV